MGRLTTLIIATALVGVALTGCLGTEDTGGQGDRQPETRSGAPGAGPSVLEATGCKEHLGIFSMDAEAVDPYLPEGFEPLPPAPPDLYKEQDPTGATATLLVVAMSCEKPQGFQNTFVWIPVDPPEQADEPGLYYAAVSLSCVADAGQVQLLAGWHIPCAPGTVALDARASTPVVSVAEMTAQSSAATFTLTGTAPSEASEVGPEWVRVFHTIDQQVCAVTDTRVGVHDHQQFGEATLDVQGDADLPLPQGPGLHSIGHTPFAMNTTLLPDGAGVTGTTTPPGCP